MPLPFAKRRTDMARMVPDLIDPAVVASERRVFAALRSASGGQNWTVLHSLGLSSDWTGEFGEIDFLVIMPGAESSASRSRAAASP